MSDRYYSFRPRYWTGTTGKLIRAAGRDAQVLGAYLFTCASASSIGLYYLPLPTLCHELGMSSEDARAAIVALQDIGFAFYDFECEEVWIPEMAAQQYGPKLVPPNHQHAGVVKLIASLRKSPFFDAFYERYEEAFHLPDPDDPTTTRPKRPKLKAIPAQQELIPLDNDSDDDEGDDLEDGDDDGVEVSTENGTVVITSDMLGDGYNKNCARLYGLPCVTLPLTEERRRKARARLKEHPDPQWWASVFVRVGTSDFLCGRGKGNWRLTFEWLTKNASNAVRVIEGEFDNGARHAQA